MNAVIALCHFCEAHGPCAVFCTQTLRDTKLDELEMQQTIQNKMCAACNSLGPTDGIYSECPESRAIFLSTQTGVLPEVINLVKQAAMRSLSSEINATKDGGFVYFGDSARGHVLSHTFHMPDLQARGCYRLYSIIILMKDKLFLINIKPFLSEHMRKISNELQEMAQKIKETEEAKYCPRSRLSSSQALTQTPRTLIELTGDKELYSLLHTHFTWILLAGSRVLTEHVTFGNLPWLPPQSQDRPPQERLSYSKTTLPMMSGPLDEAQREIFFSLAHVKQLVPQEFRAVVFCALTGIKIIVRGPSERTLDFMLCMKKLLPEQMHHLVRIDAKHQHSISGEYKIISVSHDIAVPKADESIFRIDFLNEPIEGQDIAVKWPGELPARYPDLMTKLVRAVDEARFTQLVLNRYTRTLVEEWKNKVVCLTRAKSTSSQTKLKKIMGIQPHDQPLVNYWSMHLQQAT